MKRNEKNYYYYKYSFLIYKKIYIHIIRTI